MTIRVTEPPALKPVARKAANALPARDGAADLIDVVVVGGGGHVGLPLALSLSSAGMRVGIQDVSEATVARIRAGETPFIETGLDELLRHELDADRLEVTTDPAILTRTQVVIMVIGTPVDEFLNPVMTVFERALKDLTPHLGGGSLVILRSTVFPGTTEYVRHTLANQGLRVDVAFCPERIAEGHALEELRSLPQIVGADDPAAGDRAEAFFKRLGVNIVRTGTREAELAKLLTNTWRYMKFAIANQFLVIAETAGFDYQTVFDAITRDYPRAADLPGPGFAAGPCLLKDTMQLAAFTPDHFPMGQSAMQINEGLPAFLVDSMKRRHGPLAGKTVGLLGMAFKAESDDSRASLSYKLRKLLAWEGATVLCTDPYVPDPKLVSQDEVVRDADLFVVGAPHRRYRGLDLGDRPLVDVWGIVTGRITL